MVRKLSRPRIAYGGPQARCFDSCLSTWHLRQQKPRQLFATAGVSAEKGDMILERTAKGQTVFAQLLYAPRLAAQSTRAAPTQSRYTCDGAMKWYLLLALAMPRVSLMTSHLRTSPMTRRGCCQGVSRDAGIKGTSLTARFRLLGRVRRGSFRAACRGGALRGWRGAWPCA